MGEEAKSKTTEGSGTVRSNDQPNSPEPKQGPLSKLSKDVIGGPLAGNADKDNITHRDLSGFLNREEQNNLGSTSTYFFDAFSDERSQRIASKFLHGVAQGKLEQANTLLKISPNWLLIPGIFTDYSGRTFNCTAYEYAYWSKNTRACRMLEGHMDEATKIEMRRRIEAIESDGLSYIQNGKEAKTPDFNLTNLENALQQYIDKFGKLRDTSTNWEANCDNWMKVGLAQRDLPVNLMADVYAGSDPNDLNFDYDDNTQTVYPLDDSGISGLGYDFAFTRDNAGHPRASPQAAVELAKLDLAEIKKLDKVRTAELAQSRKFLGMKEPGSHVSHSMK